MKILFGYLKPQVPRMVLGFIIKFTGTIMDLFLPWILSYIIDDVAPTGSINHVIFYGILMVLCAVIAVQGNVIANRMAAKVARDTTSALRHDLFEKISYLSCSSIDRFSISSLEARMTTDTYNLHHLVGMAQRMGVRAPILLIGGIGITLMMEPVLTLVLICILPFIALITYKVSKKGIPLYDAHQKSVDKMTGVIRENVSGIRVIKALSKMDYEKKRFENANNKTVECETRASVTMAISNPLINFLLNTALAVVIFVGAYRVNGGTIGTGKIIAFLSYFTIISNAMLTVTRIFVMFSKGINSANRISSVMNAENELDIKEIQREKTDNHIEFRNVSFSYYKKRNNVEGLNFAVKYGGSLGIIGATGSGKTTIVSLLLRLYDIDKGSIMIGGEDIRSIDPERLHNMFGIVFQSDTLFADTIKNNIDFGRGLSDEEIERAIDLSQAREFIDSLEDGNEHMLSQKGTNLSGGQKQRILLARALAKNPDILVLDDSSSALDFKTEAALRQALSENKQGITTVTVAQRISSVRSSDLIIVLNGGKIEGAGKHDELLKNCTQYGLINALQTGGVIGG